MPEWIKQPWPWYIAGPLIGLMVPVLLICGNKRLGVSSSLRHICAACFPAKIDFFNYNWRKERWNLLFVAGIMAGACITVNLFSSHAPVFIDERLAASLAANGITDHTTLMPTDLFNWGNVITLKGFLFMIAGGFLVGFGTRYAGGCTSGHAIMGLSNLQWPSLVATACFMTGGFIMANLVIPFLLKL